MSDYTVGDLVRITATFTDPAGAPVSPTTVTAHVKDPAGTITTPTPSAGGTGIYTLDLDLELAGLWYYRIAGTGTHQAAAEGVLTVAASFF